MSKIFMSILMCVALCSVAEGAKGPPMRIDVTSQPEGAQVYLNGELKGVTPFSAFPTKPGTQHLRVSAAGFHAADELVTLREGEYVQKNYALDAEKALILLTTEPEGATVTCNGMRLGVTPFLSTSLATGKAYAFEFTLNGYRPMKVQMTPEGRTPMARHVPLVLDSGTLVCSSEPSGALVLVNGIERGVTPMTVERIPKGNAVVTFRLKGFRDGTRELHVSPGDKQTLHLKLVDRPARLTIVSSPEGASVFTDDNYQGKTPVTLGEIAAGRHKITVKAAGHDPITREVTLENGADVTEEFKLASVLGRIEVVTLPGGAKISLDGKTVGSTRARVGEARSDVYAIEKVEAGKHQILAHLDGFRDESRSVTVPAKETAKIFIRLVDLFVPDTEIETIHRIIRGRLKDDTNDESVTLEIKPGLEQVFPRSEIRRITPIGKK